MAYQAKAFTHGGAGAYREIVNLLLTNGWSIVAGSAAAAGPASAMDVHSQAQQTNLTIRSAAQTATGTDMDLPVSWLRPTRVQREVISGGAVTDLVEGTDYTIDYRQGTFQAIGSGWLSDGTQRLLIAQGDYDTKKGWLVLTSSGLSTQESNLYVGLQLESTGTYNGVNSVGVRWTLFYSYTVSVTDYFDTNEQVRNKASLDVQSLVHPVESGTIYCSVNADRFLGSISIPEAHNAWAYCGALGRVRPVLEQDCVSYMVGNQSENVGTGGDDEGPVGDTISRGNTADPLVNGSVWNWQNSPPSFASDGATAVNQADLTAHYWSRRAEGGATDIIPSEAEVTPGERYFELHPVACAQTIEDLNLSPDASYGYLHGTAEGLFSVVKYLIQHRTGLVHLGVSYTVLKVGRSITRYIAIRQD